MILCKLLWQSRYLPFCIFILFPFFTIKCEVLKGHIIDTNGIPIQGAIVKISTQIEGTPLKSTISKKDGYFIVNLQDSISDVKYLIFSHRNYESCVITTDDLRGNPQVILSEKYTPLEEIIVMPSPISQRGDTIIYSVDAMRHLSDRTIGDVISHLPGVTVDSQGTILYQGEAINKFYIEEIDMLGGRYNLATSNINARDISSVSIYENHQPVKALNGISHSEKAAINISLKKHALLSPVGYLIGGAGLPVNGEKWKGELFSMFISKKMQSIFSAKASNFGRGYSLENSMRNSLFDIPFSPLDNIYNLSPVIIPSLIQSSKFINLKSQSYSINSGYKLNNDASLYANVNFSEENQNWTGGTTSYNYLGNDHESLILKQDATSEVSNSNFSATLTFKNNTQPLYINNSFLFSGNISKGSAHIINQSLSDISQATKLKKFILADNFHFTARKGRNTWQLNCQMNYVTVPDNSLHALSEDKETNLYQQGKYNTFNLLAITSFNHNLSLSITAGAELNLKYNYSSYDTFGHRNKDDDMDNLNKQKGSNFIADIGPYIQWKNKKITLKCNIPIILNGMLFSNLGSSSDKFNKINLDLGFSAKMFYHISTKIKSNISVDHSSSSGNLTDFINEAVITSYRTSTAIGSGTLLKSSSWGANMTLEYRDVLNGFFANLKLGVRRVHSNNTSVSNISSSEEINSLMLSPNNRKIFQSTLKLSKLLGNTTIRFSMDGIVHHSNKIQNQVSYSVLSSIGTVEANASIETLNKILSITPAINYSIGHTKAKHGTHNVSTSDNIRGSMDFSIFPLKKFEVKIQPTFAYSHSDNTKNLSVFLLDTSFSYEFGKFRAEAIFSNITNRTHFQSTNIFPLMTTTTYIQLRKFETLFSLQYSF